MTMIMNGKIRKFLANTINKLSNTCRCSKAAMVFNTEDDIASCYIKNFLNFRYIIGISMFRACGKANTGLIDFAGFTNFLEYCLHIGDIVHKIKGTPDIHIFSEFFDGEADNILRVWPISKKINATAKCLKHGSWHLLTKNLKFQKGVNLFTQNINMNRSSTGDFQ